MGKKSQEKMLGSIESREAKTIFKSFLTEEANRFLVINAERFLRWS